MKLENVNILKYVLQQKLKNLKTQIKIKKVNICWNILGDDDYNFYSVMILSDFVIDCPNGAAIFINLGIIVRSFIFLWNRKHCGVSYPPQIKSCENEFMKITNSNVFGKRDQLAYTAVPYWLRRKSDH